MLRTVVLAAIALALASPAEARRHHHVRYHHAHEGRPRAWCGWWLGQHLGRLDRKLWLARNWASEGSNAGGPGIGVVAVWRHHVGIIVGQTSGGQWIMQSGNDGGAVRTRPRSMRGVIAFRRV